MALDICFGEKQRGEQREHFSPWAEKKVTSVPGRKLMVMVKSRKAGSCSLFHSCLGLKPHTGVAKFPGKRLQEHEEGQGKRLTSRGSWSDFLRELP